MMKKIIFITFLALGMMVAMSGCERNDYQHPMHRNK